MRTADELRALVRHTDPQVARLAEELLHAHDRLDVALAILGGAPTHTRSVDGGRLHVLGPAPRTEETPASHLPTIFPGEVPDAR